jgi:hypothetical protein
MTPNLIGVPEHVLAEAPLVAVPDPVLDFELLHADSRTASAIAAAPAMASLVRLRFIFPSKGV